MWGETDMYALEPRCSGKSLSSGEEARMTAV
jgi:hypothetical protein